MEDTSSQFIFEACVETAEQALQAERNGAHRIELCSHLELDGMTPSEELTRQCVQRLSIPIMAMVRPRAGNFVCSEAEIRQMELEIEFFKKAGVAGVVFGLLTPENEIDLANTARLARLARLAAPLEVTFHKAIDSTSDILKSFQELNAISGITRVLTSGGMDTAWNGRHTLKTMQHFPERKLNIIAAGKIIPENRDLIAEFTGISEMHGKRIV